MRPEPTLPSIYRRPRVFGAVAFLLVCAQPFFSSAHAQKTDNFPPPPPADESQSYSAPATPVAPANGAVSTGADSLNWVPQGITSLAQQARFHTDITFDRSMLALAGDLSSMDAPTRASLARLNGISVHTYQFAVSGAYDPGVLESIRAQYGALGWKHISSQSSAVAPGATPGRTDFWIDTHGVNVAGGAVLLAGPTSVNLIVVSGDISTLDLLHLRGHFGIPRFPDNALNH